MSGRYIFTKRFLDLSARDQSAVVDATLQDLELAVGQVVPEGRRAVKRAIKRITKKAIQCGIYEEEASHG